MRLFSSVFSILLLVTHITFAETTPNPMLAAQAQLAALEKSTGGHIGLYALNTENNSDVSYRAHERFPFDCTSKTMGVAAILKKSMTDPKLLQERITYTKKDLIEWSPITAKHTADGMTVLQLCQAAMTVSDNTAMNLLVKKLGGPEAINVFARSIGDTTFDLQSWWPHEADWQWGEVKDTSTPTAMAESLQKLILGTTLAPYQRSLLTNWMKANTTGDARIRAGVPKGWIVADKTGTGFYDAAMGDIAVIWPPKHAPIVLAVYYVKNKKDAPKQQEILAEATRITMKAFQLP